MHKTDRRFSGSDYARGGSKFVTTCLEPRRPLFGRVDPYWAKLKSPAVFRQVRTGCGTLCWSEDIDVPPESVWEDVSHSITRANS